MTELVFYVSDSTAITAKSLGRSLLSQFESTNFMEYLRPYINSKEKVIDLAKEINDLAGKKNVAPIVFASMMDEELIATLSANVAGVINIFAPFIETLENRLAKKTSKRVGRAHRAGNMAAYKERIGAIDFTIATDDGLKTSDYDDADLILLGVSRTGKTPTAIYLALNFGLKVANYPFTCEDLPIFNLNLAQQKNRAKLIGLTISPQRLIAIRKERFAKGSYSSPDQVQKELWALKELFERENIAYIDASSRSIEEIAATIVSIKGVGSNILARH